MKFSPKGLRRTPQQKERERNAIIHWATALCREPETVDAYESMEGTNSTSAPASFLRLYEAVDDYRRPAQAKLRRFVQIVVRGKK